ncbi:MAG: GNAT family N-acetyltransferase, partial [Actinobacteria bacterium]|nr:GNAT family N-acetyltransferase [Actinomycetota bacterium]
PDDVEARAAETLDEFTRAREIQWEAFRIPARERAEQRAAMEGIWADRDAPGAASTFLAWLGGEPVATALAVFADHGALLIGGATLPEARGRGAYRALVRARWDEAVRRGTPALVVQAGAMSRPILDRVGFAPVCEIEILVDP